jgi:hypothetical protein
LPDLKHTIEREGFCRLGFLKISYQNSRVVLQPTKYGRDRAAIVATDEKSIPPGWDKKSQPKETDQKRIFPEARNFK